jgi:hypothetical protein
MVFKVTGNEYCACKAIGSGLQIMEPSARTRNLEPFPSDAENPAVLLAFPISPLFQRPVEFDGSGPRAIIDAGAAIPAFVRMKDDGAATGFRVGDENIDRAAFQAGIAAVTNLGIEENRSSRRGDIGNRIYLHSITSD